MALERITPEHIDAYEARLITERRISSRTIVRHLTVLHGVFKRAKRVWKPRTTRRAPIWSSPRRSCIPGSSRHWTAPMRAAWHKASFQDAGLVGDTRPTDGHGGAGRRRAPRLRSVRGRVDALRGVDPALGRRAVPAPLTPILGVPSCILSVQVPRNRRGKAKAP